MYKQCNQKTKKNNAMLIKTPSMTATALAFVKMYKIMYLIINSKKYNNVSINLTRQRV